MVPHFMTPTIFDLTQKVAVVTGAAQGMGRAMAMALAEAGASLMLVDRNEAGANQTAAYIAALGRRAIVAVHDVSEPAQIRQLFLRLDAEFGRIDFLGNVAGEGILAAPEKITLEEVEQVWRNLVLGRFCACQEAGRRMLAAGGGSIVNIGSLAAITALGRGHIAYSMAMGAVAQMTRELSTEWAGGGVRVAGSRPLIMNRLMTVAAVRGLTWIGGGIDPFVLLAIPRRQPGKPQNQRTFAS